MELAQQWLEAQKETPSFVSAMHSVDYANILDAPLPAGLDVVTPPPKSARGALGARTPQPSVRLSHAAGRPVHDELLAKGKLYQQRREALQEKFLTEQMQQLRAPRISTEARNIAGREPIHQRLLKIHQKREEEKESRIQVLEKEDEAKLRSILTFKPKISVRGKQATGKVHSMLADKEEKWFKLREDYLNTERAKHIVDELQEVRDGPEINPRSQRLAQKRLEKEGLTGLSHAEAMLERDRLAKLALWERQQKEALSRYNPNPKITLYAASLLRGEEGIGERLYQAAFEAAERKAARARTALDTHHHSPRISRVAARSRSKSQRIEDDLMERHLQALAERERAVIEEERRTRIRHTPAINPVSDAIAAQLPVSSRERLTTGRSFSSQTDASAAENERPHTGTRLHAPGSFRSTSEISPGRRAEIEARQEERRRQRRQELLAEAEAKRMSECTFKPYTSPGLARRSGGHSTPAASLPERSLQWVKKREQWRQEQLRARENNDVVECTFVPRTHDPADVQRALTPHRSSLYGGSGLAWGTQEYITRQREARERQEEERHKQTRTGSKWRNRTTVPEEPKLGRSGRSTPSIRALQRPIGPPLYGSGDEASPNSSLHVSTDRWRAAPTVRSEPNEDPLPPQSHFSSLHRSDFFRDRHDVTKPIVPFSIHEHRRFADAE